MALSKYAICRSKRSIFIKKQEACGTLSNIGLNATLNKILLLRLLLSEYYQDSIK